MGKKSITSDRRQIKILRVLGRINVGGPAVHAVLLTEGLNNQKFHSTLVTGTVGKSEGDMLYFAHQHGVQPVIVPELGREISWRDDLVALWKLYRICRRERPDIIHTHTAKAGALGRVAAVLARVPIRIHTFHGHIFRGYFGWIKTKLFILIERFLSLFTTRIVAISNTQMVDLSSRYRIASLEKFRVIPLGLDLTSLLANRGKKRRPDWCLDGQKLAIGFVGRLVPIKNPTMALKVFERFVRDDSVVQQARLIVIGDGELKERLEEQSSQAGLDDKIVFAGWQADQSSLYASLDLVILTSLSEGTPVALIEAMAAGLPFVATRVGGMLDLMVGPEQVIQDDHGRPLFSIFANGALAMSDDVEGFTAALKHLSKDREERLRMGAAGREFVRQRFSKERLLLDVQELCQECLLKNSGLTMEQAAGALQSREIHSAQR